MIKNYLRVLTRNFIRDQLYSVIIVFGLSAGITCCLIIAQYIHFELSFDRDVKDADRIYYTYMRWESTEGEFDNLCHPAIASLFESSIAGVNATVRIVPFRPTQAISEDQLLLTREVNGQVIYQGRENGMYRADPNIFSFFSIDLYAGDPARALIEPNSTVITQRLARRLFGDEDPLGKLLTVKGDAGRWISEFVITGIMEDPKENSSLPHPSLFQINALFSMESLSNWKEIRDSWAFPAFYTFIKVSDGVDTKIVEQKINESAHENLTKSEKEYGLKETIRLYPFTDLHFYTSFRNWGNAIKFTGDRRLVHFFGVLGLLILIASWANNINLTTARAIQRCKEIAVRKVNGASRQDIIIQFLLEFVCYNAISALVSLTLVQALFPHFARTIGSAATWRMWGDPLFWLGLVAFIIVSSIASGLYPAYLLSNYNTVKTLKGVYNRTRIETLPRKTLVLVQLAIAVFMIMSVYIVSLQLVHLQTKDLGMSAEQVLVLRTAKLDTALKSSDAFGQWKASIQNLEHVKSTCAVNFFPGQKTYRNYVYLSTDPYREKKAFKITGVTADFARTMGIRMLYGKDFNDEDAEHNKAIITEKAARELGFENAASALGNQITLEDQTEYEIIGILNNYRRSAKDIIFGEVLVAPGSEYNYFLVKLSGEDIAYTMTMLEARWKDLFKSSLDAFFLDSFFHTFYYLEQQFTRVFIFFCVIAVMITCMGLFGLSLFNTTSRTKEIGIRKSLGGTTWSIIWLFSKGYLKLLFTAGVISVPGSYLLIDSWLQNYPNRITIQIDAVIVPLITVICIAMLTVGYQTLNAARSNPVESLKNE